MRFPQCIMKVPIDNMHRTVEGLLPMDDIERMGHLMETLVTMDPLVKTDTHQDMDLQEVAPQEEDHLDPLVHLEILDPPDKEDHQEYLDLKEKEDILDLQDLKDHRDHQEKSCSHPIHTETNLLLK